MKGLIFVLVFIIILSYKSFAQSTCDYKLEILVDGEEFESEEFTWRMRATNLQGGSTNITGTAEIQSNGKTIKSYKPWTSSSISRQKTSNEYTPNLKPGEYKIIAEIKVDCDDTDKTNNVDTKTIKIKDGEEIQTSKNNIKSANNTKTNKIETKNSSIQKSISQNEETENVIQLKNNNQYRTQSTNPTQKPQIINESSNEKAKD